MEGKEVGFMMEDAATIKKKLAEESLRVVREQPHEKKWTEKELKELSMHGEAFKGLLSNPGWMLAKIFMDSRGVREKLILARKDNTLDNLLGKLEGYADLEKEIELKVREGEMADKMLAEMRQVKDETA